jgi:Fe-S cluster biogenesis protein NfuA
MRASRLRNCLITRLVPAPRWPRTYCAVSNMGACRPCRSSNSESRGHRLSGRSKSRNPSSAAQQPVAAPSASLRGCYATLDTCAAPHIVPTQHLRYWAGVSSPHLRCGAGVGRPSRPRLRTRRVRRAAPSRCPSGRARGLATHPRRGRTGCGEGTRTPAQAAGAGVAKLKAVGRTSRGRPQMHRHAGDAARISILRAWLQMLSGWCWACAHSALSTEAAPGM